MQYALAEDINVTVTVETAILCGNGTIDGGETCDGTNFGAETCVTQGFDTGSLTCSAGCLIETTSCSNNTGGGGGDYIAPVVIITSTATTQTTANVDWTATDNSGVIQACSFEYGTTIALGTIAPQVDRVLNVFDTALGGLTPDTTYFFEIDCVDPSGNHGTAQGTFLTTPTVSPACGDGIHDSFSEECDDGNLINGDGCSATCTIEGRIPICGDGIIDGVIFGIEECDDGNVQDGDGCSAICLLEGAGPICGNAILEIGETCDDGNLIDGDGCTATCLAEIGPGEEGCGDGIIQLGETCDDGNILNGDGCSAICLLEGAGPICGNAILEIGETCDDGNLINGDGCTATCLAESGPPGGGDSICGNAVLEAGEMCDDGNTNNGDGCSATCLNEQGPPGGGNNNCGNTLLEGGEECDDGNTLNGDGCSAMCLLEGILPPAPGEELELRDFAFWLSQRTIGTTLTPEDELVSLAGDIVTISVAEQDLSFRVIEDMHLTVDGASYPFFYQEADGRYYADAFMPIIPNSYPTVIVVDYEGGVRDIVRLTFDSLPFGQTTDQVTGNILPQVQIEIYEEAQQNLWQAPIFKQINPVQVRNDGTYGFVVPNGTYKIVALRDGYNKKETPFFQVNNHVINEQLTLLELLPEDATAVERIGHSFEQGKELVANTLFAIENITNNPTVEQVAEQIVPPVSTALVAVALLPSLWNLLGTIFRFLFLQPFLFFGKKKRKAWGLVYNSLNKLPIDLATVRLLDAKTQHIIQSRVTDEDGRFLFVVPAGVYRIEVRKPGFVCPSKLVTVETDGDLLDIYHGEQITVEEETRITPNIPIDPEDAKETPSRIAWNKRFLILQYTLSIIGILGSIIAFYIAPGMLTAIFILIHILLFLIFLRFIYPPKPESWGIVYDQDNHKPVGKAVLRLFNHEYNRLVSTRMTDSRGRYSMLLGASTYHFTVEKDGYTVYTSDPIKVNTVDKEGILTQHVPLKKNN
ncbi:DUF4215 domain-containing protein [Patescibacteria group bacterium]|nr:DUF4215 domain-containing protein [Patescibacteria group bacterium]